MIFVLAVAEEGREDFVRALLRWCRKRRRSSRRVQKDGSIPASCNGDSAHRADMHADCVIENQPFWRQLLTPWGAAIYKQDLFSLLFCLSAGCGSHDPKRKWASSSAKWLELNSTNLDGSLWKLSVAFKCAHFSKQFALKIEHLLGLCNSSWGTHANTPHTRSSIDLNVWHCGCGLNAHGGVNVTSRLGDSCDRGEARDHTKKTSDKFQEQCTEKEKCTEKETFWFGRRASHSVASFCKLRVSAAAAAAKSFGMFISGVINFHTCTRKLEILTCYWCQILPTPTQTKLDSFYFLGDLNHTLYNVWWWKSPTGIKRQNVWMRVWKCSICSILAMFVF